jgi:hypothetical protein
LAALNQVRAWIVPGWIAVPMGVATQIVLIVLIGPSSLERVVWMSILSYLPFAALNVAVAIISIRRVARVVKSAG